MILSYSRIRGTGPNLIESKDDLSAQQKATSSASTPKHRPSSPRTGSLATIPKLKIDLPMKTVENKPAADSSPRRGNSPRRNDKELSDARKRLEQMKAEQEEEQIISEVSEAFRQWKIDQGGEIEREKCLDITLLTRLLRKQSL